jgi:uncharacterized peroxidase-related enzyme
MAPDTADPNMKNPKFQIPLHTPETAAPAGAQLLTAARAKFGFVPNLLATMANAPTLLEGYLAIGSIFDKTSLTPTERQIVLLATSFANGCDYCMAAHSAIAGMQQVAPAVVTALRDGSPIADPRLEALRRFATEVVERRGWPSADCVAQFTAAGYQPAQALEVVLGVGMKTLSNYANHLAGTPLDAQFAAAKWCAPTAGNCGCDG